MCGRSSHPSLLLWIIAAGLSAALCDVKTASSLTAEAGRPVLLSCNISLASGEVVRQVRWLNRHKVAVLTYQPPALVSHSLAHVELVPSRRNASAITIMRLRPDDAGCYRCIFDIYPSGSQEGSTCITVVGKVHLEGNRTAISGKPVTLSCWYSLPERVRQVLWTKTTEQGDTAAVASYSKRGTHTSEQFRDRVRLSPTLEDSRLTVLSVRTEDEACYTCQFHTYPDGARSSTACLSVYVLPKPEVTHVVSSPGVTEANCTAQSRPPAEITWEVGDENRTLGAPVSSAYEQGDGTTTVTSTLLFQSGLLGDVAVRCVVHHRGLEKPLMLALSTNVRPAIIVLLSVCGVAAVLLLCLCVCLCKCFICTQD
ncbi:Poliovirus receptor-like [Oryzias melastigma]|uniref:Poliovirus receptor-like n=1 Tax=Oryzias melastigma TaxID=30732 RepID=A0A834F954_ORYME|nr:Poliovirus receptor-like [Oryzias melastigma]